MLQERAARNKTTIVAHCQRPAANVSAARCNFFRCCVDRSLFDAGPDFAFRECLRRDDGFCTRVHAADAVRLDAVFAMFERSEYDPVKADARARIVYFMQLGYHALEVRESMDVRMARLSPYIAGFTRRSIDPQALTEFLTFIEQLEG